jgi:hypothetical protein
MPPRIQDRTYGLIDRATGDDAPHRDRAYSIFTEFPGERRQEWCFVLPVPAGVDEVLKPSDWEEVAGLFQVKRGSINLSPFELLVLSLRATGAKPIELHDGINKMVARVLYQKFVQRQIAAGNKAWIAPRSMTQTRGEPL